MKKIILLVFLFSMLSLKGEFPDGRMILDKIDENLYSENRISTSEMVINGRRSSKTLTLKSWVEGEDQSFTEYLSPPKDKGTKMLKLDDKLWIYDPNADRIIQISGHMLRQSVMGSDLSYEDLMEEHKLQEAYKAVVIGEELYDDRMCWKLELTAILDDVAYYSRILWVDQERFLPLKEERFARSGKHLKTTALEDVYQIDDRWYARKFLFKDELKEGNGTELIVKEIEFNTDIPAYKFTKASLRK